MCSEALWVNGQMRSEVSDGKGSSGRVVVGSAAV